MCTNIELSAYKYHHKKETGITITAFELLTLIKDGGASVGVGRTSGILRERFCVDSEGDI